MKKKTKKKGGGLEKKNQVFRPFCFESVFVFFVLFCSVLFFVKLVLLFGDFFLIKKNSIPTVVSYPFPKRH